MQDLTRRQFIASSAVAGAAASLPLANTEAANAHASRGEMSFIHLFLPGGWPCNDLWDPKPESPFRKGMRGSELTSTTWPIESSAPGISLGVPLMATRQIMHHGLIVRSLTDPSNTLDHADAQRRMVEALTFDVPMREMKVVPVMRGEPQTFHPPDKTRDEYMTMFSALLAMSYPQRDMIRITDHFAPYGRFDGHEWGPRKHQHVVSSMDNLISFIVRYWEPAFPRTIVCISSEFNRTIAGRPAPAPGRSDLNTGENLIINDERDYGFHAHFAEANSIVLFGGPFKRGFVYGKTGPRHPMRVVENPVTLADMHATIATALGVQPREGRVIEDLFA